MVYAELLMNGLEVICQIDSNTRLLQMLSLALLKLLAVFCRDLCCNGTLLFLLYVNDIANAVPDQNIKMFADDTNLFIASKNPDHLNTIANAAVDDLNISLWLIANRHSLNLDKTCYMVFLPNRGGSI